MSVFEHIKKPVSRAKPLVQLTKDGKVINFFPSAGIAAKISGELINRISNCAKGKPQKNSAYDWKFVKKVNQKDMTYIVIEDGEEITKDIVIEENPEEIKKHHVFGKTRKTGDKIYEVYEKNGCKPEERRDDGIIPYYCPNGHYRDNLDYNKFLTRLRECGNPCAECSTGTRVTDRWNQIQKALDKVGGTLISKNDRECLYKCACGNTCHTFDSNLLKANIIGCQKCGNPVYNPEQQKHMKEMIKEKYNVDNVMHVDEIKSKARTTKIKEYTLPSGRSIKLQGHEHYALDILLESYGEDDLLVTRKEMPEILYENSEKDRTSRYYPDFFVKSKNTVVEVKSTYYLDSSEQNTREKFQQCIAEGYTVLLMVFEYGELLYIVRYKNDKEMVKHKSEDLPEEFEIFSLKKPYTKPQFQLLKERRTKEAEKVREKIATRSVPPKFVNKK